MKAFLLHTYRAPQRLEEAVTAALWAQGTLGLELRESGPGELEIDAYFPLGAAPSALDRSSGEGFRLVAERVVRSRDWLAEYRRRAAAFAVGRRLWVDPSEAAGETHDVPPGRLLLRFPASTAFGTGSHASTRLVLELLEELEVRGRRVLDVGFGSGILGLVALRYGAATVVGVEIDLEAALQAPRYARLNEASPGLLAGSLESLRPGLGFDLVLANILPQNVLGSASQVAERVRAGGLLVYSGYLRDSRSEVLATWRRQGLEVVQERGKGEWQAVVLAAPWR
jgi:ribosomal protein L11 methyltransferase